MNKDILNLLSNKLNLKDKSAEEILQIGIDDLTKSVKELGTEPIDSIPREKIRGLLETKEIGREIYCFKSVKSTNIVAKFLSDHVSSGTIILSETQTMGKGRSGKKYESPEGGIWLSIILKPDISPAKAPLLTLTTAVAVTRTLKSFNIDSKIKWPNDVLINDKKVCGILTESIAKFNDLQSIIVGVGINSEVNIDELPKEIRKTSISLNDVVDHVNNTKGLVCFLKEFEYCYNKFLEEDFEFIFDEWRRYNHTIGKNVEIKQPYGKVITGYAVGIDQEGALIIEKNNGKLVKIYSGECRVLK
ncbi:biotin--[acetyl-CoA-carboxylase] ligase [Methanobrevibacter wolinii]|uniref:biotin--[acetyl-CoA-carboxylase] ligase n=1 Tax=Methanobrevibacter wolinii TaxID=190977 RepID=UPI0005B28437|nr:biotin--[acetyl-CoA-carboxylase] ligase [Methanobrevibacter wolinii]MDD5959386.1 biotin--[acetyl-CoA-carboxylase] ligase [Methanobrevibacter wolinii]